MTIAQVIPFGEWTPDLPAYDNPGALIARNVIPQLNSYRQLNSLSSFTNALDDVCLGLFWLQDDNNTVFNFAGDNTKLYRLTGGDTWTDVSGPSAPYAADNWDFTKFGSLVIAANIADPLQSFDVSVSAAFADLGGSPPQAARIATIRDFVVVGDLSALGPNFIAWSGFNNATTWDTTGDISTQSDSQELFGRGGRVQRIIPGEYGVIFQEHSIYRMDYRGPPNIFQIDEVERKRGTPSPGSCAWTGGLVYYYGWDGFYVFDGTRSHEISANRVSNYFKTNAADDALDSMRAVVDRRNRLVIWAYRTSASQAINNRLIIYNWGADKWSEAEVDTQCLDEFVSPGFTLDELDGPLPAGIDTDSIPVDSDQFAGGGLNIQAFNSSNEGATFDGTPLTAIVDTKEFSGQDNRRLFVNSVRPLVEGSGASTITIQPGTRNRLQDNVVFDPAISLNSINGEANLRKNARYHRYRANISGGFSHANGVRIQARQAGRR